MSTFFNRLFRKSTAENKLLLVLLPVAIFLIFLDNFFDRLIWNENQYPLIYSFLKALVSIPVVTLVTFLLSKILDYKLSKTRMALQTSEDRFRIIFENNSSAVIIIEMDSTVSMANKSFCEMLGFTPDEIIGQSWTNLVPESEKKRLMELNRQRILNMPDLPNNYEFHFVRKTGEVRVGLMSVFFNKSLNQIVTSITDITERKKMEVSLKAGEERYRTLIELQGEGLVIADLEERFLFSNPAADRIMGLPVGGLIGKKLIDFVNTSTLEEVRKQTKLRAEGIKSTYEMGITRANGENRVLLVTATPTFNEVGKFESSLAIFIDITDRKKIEDELKKNESELMALNTTKDKLFSIIAHDLRGPVGTSADLLGVMIESYEELESEEQLKMLDILKNSAISTYNLLETLLNWSVIQTGNLVFKPELFDITKCIGTIIENMTPAAYSKNISLVFVPAEEIFIYADQNMLQTVFRNLIGNAIKYTYRDGSIEVKIDNQVNSTIISVIDNGVGMEEETRKNLFVLNKQNSKYGTENEKGTGLGLILCKEFIEKHGGKIKVESEKDKGSSFIFDIPKNTTNRELPDQKKNLKDQVHNRFNGELILIVEDDEINYQVLSSILTIANLKYERAENGKKAIDMFLKNNYRLVLMDIQLPEMNGWETTMKIRENDSVIPIIALTAYSSDPTRKKSMEAGCNEFVMKPINKVKLLQLIDKYLKKTSINS